ncbi:DUF6182 family protein [Dactylosporangium sp. NPDC051541]|uniref:DUF6182 family protein n=1 Tax=Dactylosporangium sp. NPDC051541 TaxID=3363977 RepID=UPI0037932E4E
MAQIPSVGRSAGRCGEHWLRAELARRDERAAAALRPDALPPGGVSVPVAVLRFDPAAVVSGAMAFAAGLGRADADAWLHCYTRALFLFGNPANLAGRFPPALVAPGAALAWLGVYDARRTGQVRRLLRPVEGALPAAGPDVVAGADGRPEWLLRVASAGLDLPRYLVHVHHTVAEAVLTGVLPPAATVALRQVTALDPAVVEREDPAYVRIVPPAADSATPQPRPRLVAALTRTTPAR